MSGSAGSMGRTKVGIFSYIACTPAMISVASFESMLLTFGFVLALLALILLRARSTVAHYMVIYYATVARSLISISDKSSKTQLLTFGQLLSTLSVILLRVPSPW